MARFSVGAVLVVVGLVLCLPAEVVHAQLGVGSLLGTVRDATGAVMPAVTVTAKSVDTGAVRTVTTDSSGDVPDSERARRRLRCAGCRSGGSRTRHAIASG